MMKCFHLSEDGYGNDYSWSTWHILLSTFFIFIPLAISSSWTLLPFCHWLTISIRWLSILWMWIVRPKLALFNILIIMSDFHLAWGNGCHVELLITHSDVVVSLFDCLWCGDRERMMQRLICGWTRYSPQFISPTSTPTMAWRVCSTIMTTIIQLLLMSLLWLLSYNYY